MKQQVMAHGLLGELPMAPYSSEQLNLGELINDLEANLRQNLSKLSEWREQAREILDERPGAIVSSLAIAGFMAGALLRRPDGRLQAQGPLRLTPKHSPSLDPLIIFLGTAVIGFAFGAKILDASHSSQLAGG
jgi:hypothetical protein